MPGPHRLDRGGSIDRSRPVHFTFDGRELSGFRGDTLASALLGAGVSVVGRSMKFHRPRGIFSAGVEEPNGLLTLGEGARHEPNVRATIQPLFEGLVASSQNCWPTLHFDLGRLNDFAHNIFAAGFYNKTFMSPSWHAFEPLIRRMAGLGRAPIAPDPDRYEWRNSHCDVLVIGGGAAGMLAAVLAHASGARVTLLDSDRKLGGGHNWQRGNGEALTQLEQSLHAADGVRILPRTTAVGVYDHGLVTAVEKTPESALEGGRECRERWWRIRTRCIVIATGAIEQPLAFPFNDKPGVMLADAIRHYLNRYAVAAGTRVALVTNNDSAYTVAIDLHDAGVEVPCVLDTRHQVPAALLTSLADRNITSHTGASICAAHGRSRVQSVEFTVPSRGPHTLRIDCDALGISGGWNPTSHLYCQAGGRLRFDEYHACLVPDAKLPALTAVGAAAAVFDVAGALEQTHEAVSILLKPMGFAVPAFPQSLIAHARPAPRAANGALGYSGQRWRNRAWVDFQHDVTVSDIDLSVRENLVSVEHMKRYTTTGMSLDQGKTSNLNALAILASQSGRPIADVGVTTFRPMFTPVTLGAIAGGRIGRFYKPKRRLPAHEHHVQLGAHFEPYGGWERPACYPRTPETATDAIRREALTVRSSAGLFDASPLGKILVRGPDSARFLNRIYANTMDTLEPGRVRYGLMLNERGIIIDDGVCARLSTNEFWVNTTSGGASRITGWLDEWLQTEWPELETVITEVTSAWSTVNLAGPLARQILERVPCDIDLSREAFPHMHVRTGKLCGVSCRILRVSFTGELSYEISVPASFGPSLWQRLAAAGEPLGIAPIGVEAIQLLRTEKGYLHVGSDTDGTTIPQDVGFGSAVARKAADFVGRRSLAIPEHLKPDRLQLVGLRCVGEPGAFLAGAHLLDEDPAQSSSSRGRGTRAARNTDGYLTSAVFSPKLNEHVGLGLLRDGRAKIGRTVQVIDLCGESRATVVATAHYDAAGVHLNE